jgi:uncharacterized phage protein (TIGR02220 family)
LRANLFPYDDISIQEVSQWLGEIIDKGICVPFNHNRESYCVISSFGEHQKIDERYFKTFVPQDVVNQAIESTESHSTTGPQRGHNGATTGPQRGHVAITPLEVEVEVEVEREMEKEEAKATVNGKPLTPNQETKEAKQEISVNSKNAREKEIKGRADASKKDKYEKNKGDLPPITPNKPKNRAGPKKAQEDAVITQVLTRLKELKGTNLNPQLKANRGFVKARIKEGATLEQMTQVIELKFFEWWNEAKDPKTKAWFRPATLFNSKKFWGYVEEVEIAKSIPNYAKSVQNGHKPNKGSPGTGRKQALDQFFA